MPLIRRSTGGNRVLTGRGKTAAGSRLQVAYAAACGLMQFVMGAAAIGVGVLILIDGQPYTWSHRFRGNGVTVSPGVAAGVLFAFGSYCVASAIAYARFVMVRRPPPWFLNPLKLDVGPRAIPQSTCPFCGYSRMGLTESTPCPECGRKKP